MELAEDFRGTHPGVRGRTIDSQTDRNLRHGIGEQILEPNMCRFFQDVFAFVTECTQKFKLAGGNATFRDVTKTVQETPEWLECVRLSDQMYHQSLKIITASVIGDNGELDCDKVAHFYERGADGKSASSEAFAKRSCSSHKADGQISEPSDGNFSILLRHNFFFYKI